MLQARDRHVTNYANCNSTMHPMRAENRRWSKIQMLKIRISQLQICTIASMLVLLRGYCCTSLTSLPSVSGLHVILRISFNICWLLWTLAHVSTWHSEGRRRLSLIYQQRQTFRQDVGKHTLLQSDQVLKPLQNVWIATLLKYLTAYFNWTGMWKLDW